MNTTQRLDQIEKIAQNARTTWFGLLALLVFVGVTLMGHQDADFFMHGAATQLPLVGISVPPTAFFIAAPILTAAVYCYLHVYLLGLWEALGRISQDADDQALPLSDRVFPILFTNAALWYRNRVRQDGSFRERALGRWTLAIAILMTWGFGWLVLGLLWWRSMPLHDEWITMLAGACLWLGLFFGIHGIWAARSYLRNPEYQHIRHFSLREFGLATSLLLALCAISWARTVGGLETVWPKLWTEAGFEVVVTTEGLEAHLPRARANLGEAKLTPRPPDWKPFDIWLRDHRLDRDGVLTDQDPLIPTTEEMQRYRNWLDRLDAPQLQRRDLAGANIQGAFLPGADLRYTALQQAFLVDAQLQGVDLFGALLEGADLRNTRLQGASLVDADLRGANLWNAQMHGANLVYVELQAANLPSVHMQAANFSNAKLQGANLAQAQMQGANFTLAEMQGAILRGAQMQGASFRDSPMLGAKLGYAQMQGANLVVAQMQGADLAFAQAQGANFLGVEMRKANLKGALMQGANLRNAKMQGSDCTDADFLAALVDVADVRCLAGSLSQSQLGMTVGDHRTVLPNGLWVLSCLDPAAPDVQVRAADIEAVLTYHPAEGSNIQLSRSEYEERLFCGPDEHSFKITYDPFEQRFWNDFRGIR
ncbi:MAG: pentapeptide repeat-containing protein [Pseudomonadota bacterium]